MSGRIKNEEYDKLNDEYRKRLFNLISQSGQKKAQVLGIKQSTISSWTNREKSVPDVIIGAELAKVFGKTVEEMVYGERNNYYKSTIIKQIVEMLDDFHSNEIFLNQIYGIVKSYVQNNAPLKEDSEEKRAAVNG